MWGGLIHLAHYSIESIAAAIIQELPKTNKKKKPQNTEIYNIKIWEYVQY